MRINISGEQELPDGVILHGKKPTPPDRSCGNCAKKFDCSILSYALNSIQALDFAPRNPMLMSDRDSVPYPMPCQGLAWQERVNTTFENNPLVQRLGLSDVGQPLNEANR